MSDKRDSIMNDEDDLQKNLKKRQVAAVRNKAYIFALALFIFVFWPTFLSPIEEVRWEEAFSIKIMDPINSMFRWRWEESWILYEIEQLDEKIQDLENKIMTVEIEKKVIAQLTDEQKQNTIINCLNLDICDDISEDLMKKLDFLRIFIIVNQLEGEKMQFDQKVLLRNLNEYMLRSSSWYEYWKIESIDFSEPEILDESLNLHTLDLDVWIFFPEKAWLISFLENIENKIFVDLPIMYVIEEMNYNIPEYKLEQQVKLVVKIYYFEWLETPEDDQSAE